MPGDPHEIITKAIQDEPRTAAWLLDLADHGRRAADCTQAETRSNSVGSSGPTERRADAVIRLSFPDEPDRIVICEVQNKWKEEKYYRLPGYMTRAFEDYRLPVELVLICPTDPLAARYSEGIRLGPRTTIAVHGLGPSDFEALNGDAKPPSAAAAVVAAVVRRPPPESELDLFVSTLDGYLATIDPGRAADYAKYLLVTLAEGPAALLEELMQTKSRTYHSAYSDRLRAEGREEGREEGAVQHARSTLVLMLEATQTGITPEQRGRIEACDDQQQLDAWIAKFITSGSATNLFEE
jgi:hypothetical protein